MAFSGIPLPKTVADVEAGGPLVTGLNALNNYELKRSEALYNPLKTVAQAMSQATYSNLMGPQFMAKLMNNPDFVANMKDPQKAAQYLQQVASQPTGGNALGNLAGLLPQPSLGERVINWLSGKVGFGGSQPPQQSQNALLQQPNAPMQNQSPFNYNQGQSNLQRNQGAPIPGIGADSGMSFDKNGNNIRETDQEVERIARQGNAAPSTNEEYFRRSGKMLGTKEQEKELGKARGQAISELGKQYLQDTEAMAPLNRLAKLTQSPVFMNMRKDIPFFQGLQLQGLSKIGDPQQQKIIGDFMADTRTAIANTVNSFSGRAMAKEFDFARTLKIGDDDTLGVMLGKLESLMTFKQATMERNVIARNLMKTQHMDEGDAYEIANKKVDMDKIRDNIASQLSAPVKVKNKKTGETKLISLKEYNDGLSNK
jgi:hypothetical protein